MGSSDSRLADTVADGALAAQKSTASGLVGKVALITGPTSGIGYETARVLAKHGCHVVLAARDAAKLEKVKEKLIADIKKEKGEGFTPLFSEVNINLGSLESVRNAATQFNNLGLPLHYLIANAGLFSADSSAKTVDGFESQVGTNHLGHYYFTRLLLTKLRSTATASDPARIVIVSSRAHLRAPINDVNHIEKSFHNPPNGMTAGYGISKLYNLYHAKYLAQSEKSNNILAFSLHPGVVSTDIARDSAFGRFIFSTLGSYVLKNSNQGASTTIHCTLAATADQSGGYFSDNALTQEGKVATNDAYQRKIIEISEKLVNEWEAAHPTH